MPLSVKRHSAVRVKTGNRQNRFPGRGALFRYLGFFSGLRLFGRTGERRHVLQQLITIVIRLFQVVLETFGILRRDTLQLGITVFTGQEVTQRSVGSLGLQSQGRFALFGQFGVEAIQRPVTAVDGQLAFFHALAHTLAECPG